MVLRKSHHQHPPRGLLPCPLLPRLRMRLYAVSAEAPSERNILYRRTQRWSLLGWGRGAPLAKIKRQCSKKHSRHGRLPRRSRQRRPSIFPQRQCRITSITAPSQSPPRRQARGQQTISLLPHTNRQHFGRRCRDQSSHIRPLVVTGEDGSSHHVHPPHCEPDF